MSHNETLDNPMSPGPDLGFLGLSGAFRGNNVAMSVKTYIIEKYDAFRGFPGELLLGTTGESVGTTLGFPGFPGFPGGPTALLLVTTLAVQAFRAFRGGLLLRCCWRLPRLPGLSGLSGGVLLLCCW